MKRAGTKLLLVMLTLTPLGCPLLHEDDFVLVDAETATSGGAPDDTPPSGGAPDDVPPGGGAPTALPCPPTCDSCAGNVCVLSCVGDDACKDAMLACPTGRACRLECSGKSACAKLRLRCPATEPCTIECADAKDVCQDMAVTCGTSRCEAQCHGEVEGPRLDCGKSAACVSCP
jgi:hypothetical protein